MDDLISRQAAIKAFSVYNGKHIPEVDCDNMPVEISIKQVKDTLRSLPSEDRPTGKWVINRHGRYVCSNCGVSAHDADGTLPDNGDDPYCWHCGAKMEVQNE